ncbi:MAG: amidohydrolase [Fibrobacter sp.]|nr:amidohydrolase [Fibrobacter sp.]
MKKNENKFLLRIISASLVIFIGFVSVFAKERIRNNQPKSIPRLIAHAGGDINGMNMTNSRQALDQSYSEGFRYIELDISMTSDGVPFLVHDWNNGKFLLKKNDIRNPPTYKEISSCKTVMNLELLDLARLAQWLKKHKNVYIITDIKDDNLKVLQLIKVNYPAIVDKIIPQIYKFEEYEPVKNMGYDNIILTLYRMRVTDEEVVSFCQNNSLFGLTVSSQRANQEFLKKLSVLKIPVYAHTINEYSVYKKLRQSGVYGVYTDYFQPDKWDE